jgi:ADP-heptose:LPS heptosyltransferase
VVDLGFLGDTVHLLPSLREIKRNYPQAALHVITTPVGCEVLTMAPWVDRAWAVEMSPQKRTFRQQWQVIKGVRREGFDVAYNFSGADRTLFMTALTGAPERVAFAGGRSHFWRNWLIQNWVQPVRSMEPVFERRRQMLAACGVPLEEPQFDLEPPKDAQDWAAGQLLRNPIHFSINASTHLKEWPLEHWTSLAKLIWQERPDLQIVASASGKPRELKRLETFICALKGNPVLTYTDLTIPRLAALLERCSLHVGPDSGVLHIATALGKPTVSLFREYPGMQGWLPRGPGHSSLVVDCSCAKQKVAACLQRETARCLAELPPDRVLAAILEKIKVMAWKA